MSLAFDATFYQQSRPDVYNAFIATAGTTGLSWAEFAQNHYNTFGRFEGSNPNAQFDTSYYLETYPDVAAAGVNPFDHFLANGAGEGRFPTLEVASSGFVEATYLAANPDVQAAVTAGTFTSGYQHWILNGQFEGRSGAPTLSGESSGSTFTLTTAIDNVTGTSGNDTIIGDLASTSVADQIDGGAGTDTLRLFATVVEPTHTGVEILELNGAPVTTTFDVSDNSDVTTLNLINPTTLSTFTIANGQAVSIESVAAAETIDLAGNTVTGLGLTVSGFGTAAADANLDLNSTAQTSLTLASGSTTSGVAIANTGGALATITVTGDTAIDISHALTTVTTIDASATTGGIDVEGVGASNLTFTGGTGDDSLNLANTITKDDVVDGGAGTDTLALNQAGVTIVQGLSATDKATLNGNLSNLEVVRVTDALTGDIDASRFDSINNYVLSAGINNGGTSTLSSVASGVAVTIGDAAGTATDILAVEITDATLAGNNSDAVTINLTDAAAGGASDAGVVNLVGVDILNIDTTQATGGTTTSHTLDIAATSSALDTVTITGNTALDISTVPLINSIQTVDASGMTLASATANGLTVAIAAGGTNGVAITGSGGVDNITGSAAADIINGGAGNDVITGSTGNDVMTGGDGNDNFNIAAGDTGITSSSFDEVTDYSNTTVVNTTDTLTFTSAAGVVGTTALAGWTVTNGVATQNNASVSDFITAVQGAGTANETYAFVSGSDTYVYNAGANGTTNTTDDSLIKLTGFTGVSVVTADSTTANEILIA